MKDSLIRFGGNAPLLPKELHHENDNSFFKSRIILSLLVFNSIGLGLGIYTLVSSPSEVAVGSYSVSTNCFCSLLLLRWLWKRSLNIEYIPSKCTRYCYCLFKFAKYFIGATFEMISGTDVSRALFVYYIVMMVIVTMAVLLTIFSTCFASFFRMMGCRNCERGYDFITL